MILKILTLYVFFMFTEFDAKYSKYHKPIWQGSRVPWFGTYQPIAPAPLHDETFTRLEDHQHLTNMSIELIKDVHVKDRHSQSMQREYKADVRYTLGTMVAGTVEKYSSMAKIYRYYVSPNTADVPFENERKHTHATISMIQGYQAMQGAYTELVIESQLYFDYIANNAKSEIQEDDTGKGKPPTLETLQKDFNADEWNNLNEIEQMEKLEKMKAMYSKGSPQRRMAGVVKRSKLRFTPDAAQEEYKRSIRYQAWAKKWNGFNPKMEGIEISQPVAKLGRNFSKFLNVNPF